MAAKIDVKLGNDSLSGFNKAQREVNRFGDAYRSAYGHPRSNGGAGEAYNSAQDEDDDDDEQSFPSAPPSSAGLDGYESGHSNGQEASVAPMRNMLSNESTMEMENGNDNDTKDITTVNEQQGSLDASDGPERPASVRDTDSSSVKTLIGSPQRIQKKAPRNYRIGEGESGTINEDGGQQNESGGDQMNGGGDAVEVDNIVFPSTNENNDNNGGQGTEANQLDDQVFDEADSYVQHQIIDNNNDLQNNFLAANSLMGTKSRSSGESKKKDASDFTPMFNFQQESVTQHHGLTNKRHDDDDEDEDDESKIVEDDYSSALNKKTHDILMKKKAAAAASAKEWDAKKDNKPKSRTKVCSIL